MGFGLLLWPAAGARRLTIQNSKTVRDRAKLWEIWGSHGMSVITAKHFCIFPKISKKFKNFKFALISETVRDRAKWMKFGIT